MKITKIRVENFKSYKKMNLDVDNLNFIIGGNASGKSNFVNILKFINDIVEYGIEDAISLQGGLKFLFNSNSRKDSNLIINVEFDLVNDLKNCLKYFPIEKKIYMPSYLDYTLKIKPNLKGDGYKITEEKAIITFEKYEKNNKEKVGEIDIKIVKDSNGKVINNFEKNKYDDSDEFITLKYMKTFILDRYGLIINNFFSALSMFYRYNEKIKIYNFDVNSLKSPSSIVARNELEEDGSNLVNIIQKLLKNKTQKEKLNKLIKIALPFVEDIKVESNVNKSLFFKVQESYNKNEFPSYMLSDGTVNILALIVALYFQSNNDIIILEEPERNIHPKLLGTVVSLLEEVSATKQIFVTTHNAYIIKEADINDIFLVSRNEKGISNISKPVNDDKIAVFLENDLGIDDLFVEGILK
ncbi:MAG: AAA family ATPase [Bacilli bacterium]|nr:AAA family ATPase [Bacilli bacterium]